MPAIGSYLGFLQALLALGPNLPAVILKIQHIVADVQDIIALLNPPQMAAAGHEISVSAAEEAAEAEVVNAMSEAVEAGPSKGREARMQAIGDGTFLRMIWAFVQANPKLLDLLLSLLTMKA